jgi:dolichol-phosphate mannosyltransferase
VRTLIILPTYNERENIDPLLKALTKYGHDILFIDDNSPDQTHNLILERSTHDNRIKSILRQGKMGIASAYMEGFSYAIKNGYDRIITMDSDLSHPPDKIPELLADKADLTVGSRYIKGGRIEDWPLYRHILSRFANIFAKFMLKIDINDLTSGFMKISVPALSKIDIKNLHSRGYGFLIELKFRLTKAGEATAEIPIVFSDRKHGVSKLEKRIIWEAFWLVLRLNLKT